MEYYFSLSSSLSLIETIDMTISQHINSDVRIIRTIQISDKVKLVWKSYNNCVPLMITIIINYV